MSRGMPYKQKNLLEKSKESVLLAVNTYNSVNTNFRIGGFIVLMIIGWTSLLHAIFEKNGIKYFYKQKNGRNYKKIDGDNWSRDIKECIKEYFLDSDPIKQNIDFFIKIRNKIEHRFMPNIDKEIVGECQALLINFEKILVREFGENHILIDRLFVPLQLSAKKQKVPFSKDEKKVISFIKSYRNNLDSNIFQSSDFSYRMYLIPKLANHISSSDVAIEFIKIDNLTEEEKRKYEKFIIGIKDKKVIGENVILSDDPNAIKISISYKEAVKTHPLTAFDMKKKMREYYKDYPDGKGMYNKLIVELKKDRKLCIERLTNPGQKTPRYTYLYSNDVYEKFFDKHYTRNKNTSKKNNNED